MSRYSSFDGYWLFGFLVNVGQPIEIDLIPAPPTTVRTPLERAQQRARQVFHSQLAFHDVKFSEIATAMLTIDTHPQEIETEVNGKTCIGHPVEVTAVATSAKNRTFKCVVQIGVARHDSNAEFRSADHL